MSPVDEPREEEVEFLPEEEDELEQCLEDAREAARNGELIPWEAVFPPKRLTG